MPPELIVPLISFFIPAGFLLAFGYIAYLLIDPKKPE